MLTRSPRVAHAFARPLGLATLVLACLAGCRLGPGGVRPACDDCGTIAECGAACEADRPAACGRSRCWLGRLLGCGGCAGCGGEVYWSEWHNDPPALCDPCDGCGHRRGPCSCRPPSATSPIRG